MDPNEARDLMSLLFETGDGSDDTTGQASNAVLRDRDEFEQRPFSYENLHAFKLARAFKRRAYGAADHLPRSEQYNTGSQLRRSALSVVLNLVEGNLRSTPNDRARFTETAFGSLHEAFVCVMEAEEEGHLPKGSTKSFRKDVTELSAVLSNLRTAQLKQPRAR